VVAVVVVVVVIDGGGGHWDGLGWWGSDVGVEVKRGYSRVVKPAGCGGYMGREMLSSLSWTSNGFMGAILSVQDRNVVASEVHIDVDGVVDWRCGEYIRRVLNMEVAAYRLLATSWGR
jgi:hypothetical protein